MKKIWCLSAILLISTLVGTQCVFPPVVAVGDRSLYLSFNKPLYALGETIKITVLIGAESCRQHNHLFELYVYDSRNLLLSQIAGERPGGLVLRPEDFPFTLTYTPPKADVYTIKLWVTHSPLSWGHQTPYLEETATLTVAPYLATTQTTTTQATTTATSMSSQTITTQLTTTTKPTVSTRTTATETEAVKTDLTSPLAMASVLLVIAAVIAFGLVALRRRKNRGQLPSRAKTTTIPENKYCIQCGGEIPRDAPFCTKCGAKQNT